jgi:hypothetical protein
MSESRVYTFRCECHGFHFLSFMWWPYDKDSHMNVEGYLSVGGDFWHTLPVRIKNAWYVLRGRNAHALEMIVDVKKAEDLKRVLELYLADARTGDFDSRDAIMSCPCGRGDYHLCQDCPYITCSVHGKVNHV